MSPVRQDLCHLTNYNSTSTLVVIEVEASAVVRRVLQIHPTGVLQCNIVLSTFYSKNSTIRDKLCRSKYTARFYSTIVSSFIFIICTSYFRARCTSTTRTGSTRYLFRILCISYNHVRHGLWRLGGLGHRSSIIDHRSSRVLEAATVPVR